MHHNFRTYLTGRSTVAESTNKLVGLYGLLALAWRPNLGNRTLNCREAAEKTVDEWTPFISWRQIALDMRELLSDDSGFPLSEMQPDLYGRLVEQLGAERAQAIRTFSMGDQLSDCAVAKIRERLIDFIEAFLVVVLRRELAEVNA